MLVNGAIGEMAEEVSKVIHVVTLGGEANDALFKEVKLEWPQLGDKHIYAHVPLGAADQQRVVDVLLNHALLVVLQVLQVVDD